jgi:hypothetical protein
MRFAATLVLWLCVVAPRDGPGEARFRLPPTGRDSPAQVHQDSLPQTTHAPRGTGR